MSKIRKFEEAESNVVARFSEDKGVGMQLLFGTMKALQKPIVTTKYDILSKSAICVELFLVSRGPQAMS